MAPLEQGEAEEYTNRGGEFTTIKKLVNPGQSVVVRLLDITKHFKTKYPVKDKEYCYRVKLERDGKGYLMDINGKDAIGQIMNCLHPNGFQAPLVPCFATFTRRTERKSYQSEIIITRGDELTLT